MSFRGAYLDVEELPDLPPELDRCEWLMDDGKAARDYSRPGDGMLRVARHVPKGKHPMLIVAAMMRKLLGVAYGVLKSRVAFDSRRAAARQ
jgi:hypothetical protein